MKKEIPKFQSEAQEFEFWSSAESTVYIDWQQATPAKFPSLKPTLRTIPASNSIYMPETKSEVPALPADDPTRGLTIAQLDSPAARHIGLAGDTYTITVAGEDTGDRFCVIDMHVPPGGGPGPHRHDFEETFVLLEGEMEITFRGERSVARAGDTINVPSNAPHQFHNSSPGAARMICICSPAGNDRFFLEVGVPVATRTTAPPKLDERQMAEFAAKAKALAPKYRTELLERA